jgi:hypothetical protein
MNVSRTIDLELLIDALIHLLFVKTLAMDSHLLSGDIGTETGSLTFLTLSGLLDAMLTRINITYLEYGIDMAD